MNRDWTEEQIAALVDGSVDDPAEVERLRRAIAEDPQARAHAERLAETGRLLRAAYALPDAEPMPEAIRAAIAGRSARVVPLRRSGRPRSLRIAMPLAAAASVLLAVGVGLWLQPLGKDAADGAIARLAPSDGPLHLALETAPSGEIAGGIRPMLTFRDASARPCREYERIDAGVTAALGIACRTEAGRWQIEARSAVAVVQPGEAAYAPASGEDAAALGAEIDQALERLGAAPPLDPGEEAALLRRGWAD